jgi:hypothetical protein
VVNGVLNGSLSIAMALSRVRLSSATAGIESSAMLWTFDFGDDEIDKIEYMIVEEILSVRLRAPWSHWRGKRRADCSVKFFS